MSGPRRNDIAIIGMSCRFPGAATVEEYWKNLCDGVESVTFFSDQELVAAGVDPSLVAHPRYVKSAPVLPGVEMFDSSFFGYSPKDAALMDPQHRLFLEVCWEAFENAGYDPAGYPGKVGVLSTGGGVVASYLLAKLHHTDFPGQTASTAHINNDKDFLSTRVSFKLNLTGPSFTIQSACSSSLVAIHQACQNLRFNECDMMLAGGAVVRVPQVEGYLAEKRNLYSMDGHCRPFDSSGQGTIFGSGVGVVLLKPLEKAVADRDHVFAVIKATAANNDGSAKISYTASSVGQQSEAVADALKLADVSADSIGYVECHATGTSVGDPLEIEALTLAFRKGTSLKQYCAVGSVKANIGHPEQAAGIAGLIKTALVLHHKRIPPSINYETPNPRIDFASSPFFVNTTLRDFPLADTPRRAGLNGLGIGGTNTFAILEEAPPSAVTRNESADHCPCLVTLSAKSADGLAARVEQLLNWLGDNPDAPVGDVCYTTNVSRSQFGFRFAAPARSAAELKKRLESWLETAAVPSLQRTSNGPIAFMFSGQGSQYAGMAAKLYRTHAVFRNAMDQCHAFAEPYLEQGLREVIFAGDDNAALVNRTDYTQPALFAVEYALAELVKSWGIAPAAVIGHSLGEITAACAANVITLKDAMRLVAARGALMHRLPSGGGMAAIFAEESVVRTLIDKTAPRIAVAAMNGPLNTVVSGDQDALAMLFEELDRKAIRYRELQVSVAFHSPRTEAILDDLEEVAGQIKYDAPRLPVISNLTGEPMAAAPDKFYWRRHAREAVRFQDGMLALAGLECRTFLEIGPHPVLLPMAQVCLGAKGKSAAWVATLNRQKSDTESVTEMLVALYLAGHNINWTAVHADSSWRRIPLPTYPFQRQRHWIEDNTIHTEKRSTKAAERLHPLVGTRLNSITKEIRYEARYGVQHIGYLSDHKVVGTVVLPTTAELEAATIVGRMHFGTSRIAFEDAMHHQAMSFANGEDRSVRVLVTPQKSDRASFRLVSADTEDSEVWRTHMTGTLRKSEVPSSWPAFSTKQVRTRCSQTLAVADFYDRLDKLGLEYGPSFRGVRELYLGHHEALTKVRLPDGLANTQYVMHPALLDACLHTYPLVLDGAEKAKGDRRNSYLPVSLAGFRCYQDGIDQAWVHTRLRRVDKADAQVVDIRIYDDAERPVAELDGLTVRLLPLEKVQLPQAGTENVFYQAVWRKSDRGAASVDKHRAPASWMIFADAKGVGVALAGRLEAAGNHCHIVYRDDAFAHRGARTWTVNERQPHDFRRLLEQFSASETLPCDGVVYLWGLDAPSIDGLTLAGLKSGSEMMCRGALAILHALAETRSTNPRGRRLWFVTANSQKTEGHDRHVDPVPAPLWGLGRTAAIEYPSIWGGLIDLQFSHDRVPNIDLLAADLLHPDGETQIAISADGQRSVPRFVRHSLDELQAQVPRVRGDATYLVTGGLGMLGRSVAKWLIGQGARHLVLTGRNPSSEATRELLGAAEFNGAAIRVVAADISRDEDVSRLVQTISNELPPLKGVVQSAGVLDDGILAQLDWDRFARLFGPKVYGSWLLHEHTKSLELDFFIFKSSLLSLLGSAGQANYAASNSFLDSLVTHRRAVGLPATAINWCAWSGGGLATVSGARGEAMWSSLGVKSVSPDFAMQLFDKLMHHDVEQIAVAIADWRIYASKVGKPTFLAELLTGNEDFPPPKIDKTKVALGGAPVVVNDQSRPHLLSRLQQRMMAELGFEDPIDPDRPLNEVGLDSLRSVTLANNLEDEFGVLVSISELISGPTINELVNHLLDLLAGIAKDEPGKSGSATASTAGIGTLTTSPPIAVSQANLPASPAASGIVPALTAKARIASDQFEGGLVTDSYGPDDVAINPAGNGSLAHPEVGLNGKTPPASMTAHGGIEDFGTAVFGSAGEVASRTTIGKWLIPPRPNPDAKARLFCFPFAGGGLGSFRSWARLFGESVEVVAVEAPGRGTRINETAIDDLDIYVERLLPEMVDWLDRPSAFFGHCLGGLTMFATLCALPRARAHFIKHAFACGVRPPHLLKRKGEFEDNLAYDMMLHQDFDIGVPLYAQADEIFTYIIRQFDIPAANKMLDMPTLRKVLLPTIRAEFGMAYNYKYQPVELFSFPISSFVGNLDPWVSEEDSAGWGKLTRGGFTNHVRKGSHFLMADDGDYILETISNEFVNSVVQEQELHVV
jgi:acyl transferase domain-containing protein/surfactin synthase thioesterase subunit/acyl carrier protein